MSDSTIRREGNEVPTEQVALEPLPNGGRLGRFIIVEVVGQGGMGVVYRAYDPALDRRVALKLLRRRAGEGDTGGTARLAREAQAMARLAHPNVVPVYDVGRSGDSLFVAMEFVQGSTLQGWLAEQPRSWREVVEVCVQAGRGLEAAHAAGIIHRDFKPANVLVGKDGRARVTDFGLARSNGDIDRPSTPIAVGALSLETPLTVAGSVMGTPGYMAPEQYLGQPSSPATDQYAFCATLCEALYGQRPFLASDLQTMARLTQAGQVPPPPKGSTVPAWLFPIVARGLAPNPELRHASMSALLEQLSRDPSARRRQWALTMVASLVCVTAAAGLWGWPRMRASSCHGQTEQLATVWDEAARGRVQRAFLDTRQPFAQLAYGFVRTTLDGFTASWASERHRACDDTLLRQTRTERQLALRLSCLENRRVELQTLIARFQEADEVVVSQAVAAVSRLTSVERCADVELLEHRAALNEGIRRQTEAIEQQLSEGRMLVALGRFADASRVLKGAITEARALNEPHTVALALLERGALEHQLDHFADARVSLDEALRGALMTGDDRTALHAAALLTSLVGWRLTQPREALVVANVGRGLVPRVGDPVLEGLLEEGEGDARWQMGDSDGALAAYQRALERFGSGQGPTSLDVARMHSSIGWVLMERGELGAARAEYEKSRGLREALLGSEHPTLARTFAELGHLVEALDDREAAVSVLRRGYELRVRTGGREALGSAHSALNLARVLSAAGHLDEAQQMFGPAAVLLAAQPSYGFAIQQNRALLLLDRGDVLAALEAARNALALVEPQDEYSSALGDAVLGFTLVGAGDDAAARVSLERALAKYERLKMKRSQGYGRASLALAKVAARQRSPDRRALAEQALAMALTLDGNTRLKAEASLVAAKALVANGATSQARAAAAQAITFAVEPDQAPLKAEAEQLLAEHPLE